MTKQTFFQLFFALLVLGFCQSSSAQISVGARAGVMLINIDKDPLQQGEPKPENRVGFQVAVPVEIAFGEMFAIQPEIMYGPHGAKQEDNSATTDPITGFTSTVDIKLDYLVNTLEIPVLGKVKFGPEMLKFHVLAGPSIGFGLNGKSKSEGSIKITNAMGTVVLDNSLDGESTAKFVKDGYDPSDVAADEFAVAQTNFNLHMGAGLSFNLGGISLFLDGRYMLGLSDFSPDPKDTPKENEVTVKSKRIGASVGVMFSLN